MKKVIIKDDSNTIDLQYARSNSIPIFAVKDNKVVGLIIYTNDKGYFISIGHGVIVSTCHLKLEDLIKDCEEVGYIFVTDITV